MKRLLILTFLTIFVAAVLALTLKGNAGNPDPNYIYNHLREQGQPLELSPERGRYALASSIAEDHSVFLNKDRAFYVTPDLGMINGKYIVLFSPGMSIVAAPFYALGAKFGFAQIATFSVPAIFAILNFLLIIKISRQLGLTLRSGALAALIYLFATTAFAYSVSFYQHQTTTFFLLATSSLLFTKRNALRLALAAFLATMSFWIDSQNPIFFVPLAFYALTTSLETIRDDGLKIRIRLTHLFAIFGVVVALATYAAYSQLTFGKPFQLSGTATSVREFDKNGNPVIKRLAGEKEASKFFNPRRMIHGVQTLVFSSERGLVVYAPILLAGIFGVGYLYKKERGKLIALAGTIAIIFTLYTMWGDPWGGWAFGPRYLVPMFAFASILAASAHEDWSAKTKWLKRFIFKIIFSLLLIFSLGVNLLGTLTTNQVPPKVEAVPLKMKWNFTLNWDVFSSGKTSSFLYKTYLSDKIELKNYALAIFLSILLVTLTTVWWPKRNKNNA